MRAFAFALTAAVLAAGVSLAQEKKADPPKPAAEVKLPDGVTKGVTVEGLTEYKLTSNGLRIILLPDASRPKVTVNCTIFVGSRHEGYGETGMAHLLEHMVFKGCPKFPDVPKALRDHGADFNGTTWLDRTNYYETMPAGDDNLEFGIELEADRLVNSFIAREELMKEFTVVRNEFEMGENNAERVLSQRMVATAFEWHNYGKSTIGNRTDIERVPVDNLKAFYKKYYRPDNAMLIVAGAFDEGKALAYIAKHFGPLKNPEEKVPVTYTEEPAQDGERLVTLRRVGKVGATGVVYHVPAARHPDFSAVDVLESVLTNAPSGRVYKALVEGKLASSVSGSTYPLHDPGFLEVTAQTDPANTEKARDALVATLENLAKEPITDEEVERAKKAGLKQFEQIRDNSQQWAITLSEFAAAGDWRLFFLYRDRLEAVTAADVNRVAQKYLIRSNRTVGVYVPTDKAERAEVPAAPDVKALVDGYKGRTAVAAGEAFDPTPENVEKRVQRGTVGEGIKYALLPKKTRGETVTMTLNLRVGDEKSLAGKNAAFDFLGPMLTKGTKGKTRQQIKDEFDKLKASVGISSDGDRGLGLVAVSVQAKRANLPAVLTLLGEVLREPTFPEKEFEVLKKEELDALEKGKTDPQLLAVNALMRKLSPYPKEDVRYMPTVDEAIERVKAVTAADVKKLYEEQLGASAGELVVVGDFDPAATLEQVNAFLKGWKSAVAYKRIERPYLPTKGEVLTIDTPDKENAFYVTVQTMELKDSDPEYAPLAVGNYLLGEAPLASRISNRVRGSGGLSYMAMSQAAAGPLDKSGGFITIAITNPKNLDKVDAMMTDEVGKFIKEGVSASELEDGKKAWLKAKQQERASDGTLAAQLATGLFVGRTMTYYADLERQVEGLEPGDVKKAFDKLIDPKRMVVIKAGDLKKKDAAEEKKDDKKEEKKDK
jgi:zinc protease